MIKQKNATSYMTIPAFRNACSMPTIMESCAESLKFTQELNALVREKKLSIPQEKSKHHQYPIKLLGSYFLSALDPIIITDLGSIKDRIDVCKVFSYLEEDYNLSTVLHETIDKRLDGNDNSEVGVILNYMDSRCPLVTVCPEVNETFIVYDARIPYDVMAKILPFRPDKKQIISFTVSLKRMRTFSQKLNTHILHKSDIECREVLSDLLGNLTERKGNVKVTLHISNKVYLTLITTGGEKKLGSIDWNMQSFLRLADKWDINCGE